MRLRGKILSHQSGTLKDVSSTFGLERGGGGWAGSLNSVRQLSREAM
jgi:hypothetical protein